MGRVTAIRRSGKDRCQAYNSRQGRSATRLRTGCADASNYPLLIQKLKTVMSETRSDARLSTEA